MKDEYLKKAEEEREKQEKYLKWHKRFGYYKILTVLFFFFFLYLWLKQVDLIFILLTIISFEGFILLVACHEKALKLLDNARRMEKVNLDYIDRMEGRWNTFDDRGEEFIPKNHDYCIDLDILGKNSLYQLLNTGNTYFGRKFFAEDLLHPLKDKKEIEKRQDAIWEMAENKTFIKDFQCHSVKTAPNTDLEKIINLLRGDKALNKISIVDYFLVLLPVFSIIFTACVFLLKVKSMYMVPYFLFGFQLLLWFFGFIKKLSYLSAISNSNYKLGNFVDMFKMIEGRTFESGILKKIKESFIRGEEKASVAMFELNIIISCINMRRNAVVYFILNIFLLWDYACIFALKLWRDKNQNAIEEWFRSVGHLESLISFANLKLIDEGHCVPEINTENKFIGKGAGHPLIRSETRVGNSFTLLHHIFIVSGSNMSGKTTFLRTLGINMVLGLNGGFVLGEHMSIPAVRLISSMRNIDDLNEGASTFYAELKKIKAILEAAEGEQILFLIDEIFKGTNSVDRLKGAEGVIRKLSEKGAIGLITTHDLELCQMAEENKMIENYSFNEQYEKGKIKFDYKLKKGRSESTNAKYLMEMLNIL